MTQTEGDDNVMITPKCHFDVIMALSGYHYLIVRLRCNVIMTSKQHCGVVFTHQWRYHCHECIYWGDGACALQVNEISPVSNMFDKLRPRQNGHFFLADDIFTSILLNDHSCISIIFSIEICSQRTNEQYSALVYVYNVFVPNRRRN